MLPTSENPDVMTRLNAAPRSPRALTASNANFAGTHVTTRSTSASTSSIERRHREAQDLAALGVDRVDAALDTRRSRCSRGSCGRSWLSLCDAPMTATDRGSKRRLMSGRFLRHAVPLNPMRSSTTPAPGFRCMSNPIFSNRCSIAAFSKSTSAVNPRRPCLLRELRQVGEKFGSDALALVVVPHHESDLGGVALLVDAVLPDADDLLDVLRRCSNAPG